MICDGICDRSLKGIHLKVPNLPFTLNFRQWLPPKDPFVCFILSIRDFPHFQSYDRSGRRDAENHQSYEKSGWVWMLRFTLPETNIAHENHHLSWQIPSKWWIFQPAMLVSGRDTVNHKQDSDAECECSLLHLPLGGEVLPRWEADLGQDVLAAFWSWGVRHSMFSSKNPTWMSMEVIVTS